MKPCRKCLLSELSDRALYEQILQTVQAIPEERRCGKEEYERRLSLCRSCEVLFQGMCRECGCFVEVRAAESLSRCPAPDRKW